MCFWKRTQNKHVHSSPLEEPLTPYPSTIFTMTYIHPALYNSHNFHTQLSVAGWQETRTNQL